MKVHLTSHEALLAAHEGATRRLRRIYNHATPDRFNPEHRFDTDVEATAAELAFARFMGLYWSPSSGAQSLEAGDVGGWEIKHTRHEHGHLAVYSHTPDELRCVLVTGCIPDFVVRGWMVARSAKREQYRRVTVSGSLQVATFHVPQTDLRTFSADDLPVAA